MSSIIQPPNEYKTLKTLIFGVVILKVAKYLRSTYRRVFPNNPLTPSIARTVDVGHS